MGCDGDRYCPKCKTRYSQGHARKCDCGATVPSNCGYAEADDPLDDLLDQLRAYGLDVKCPSCRKWSASYFNFGGYAFRCAGCRKEVSQCRCQPLRKDPTMVLRDVLDGIGFDVDDDAIRRWSEFLNAPES